MRVGELKNQFPGFSLEDKLSLATGGIDMLNRVYVRRKKLGVSWQRRKREVKFEEFFTSLYTNCIGPQYI